MFKKVHVSWHSSQLPEQKEGLLIILVTTFFDSLDDFTKEHVFDMLMKNWERVYHGEEDDFGDWYDSTRAPWGLYMHAAWFFGDYYWHYEGYRMFLDVRLRGLTNNIITFYYPRKLQIRRSIPMFG